MKRLMVAAFVVMLLAGCSTKFQEIKRPDGAKDYWISCGKLKTCYNKANELCPNGYATLSEDDGVFSSNLRIGCRPEKKAGQ